ncbi:unnamed protein product, partial [Ixodes persulcatus]
MRLFGSRGMQDFFRCLFSLYCLPWPPRSARLNKMMLHLHTTYERAADQHYRGRRCREPPGFLMERRLRGCLGKHALGDASVVLCRNGNSPSRTQRHSWYTFCQQLVKGMLNQTFQC